MGTYIAAAASAADLGLRRLAAALGGRLELAARFERPLEALSEDYLREIRRAERERTARRDFERAWKTF
jgi:predicted DNA-binding protein (UPF0278 family)